MEGDLKLHNCTKKWFISLKSQLSAKTPLKINSRNEDEEEKNTVLEIHIWIENREKNA